MRAISRFVRPIFHDGEVIAFASPWRICSTSAAPSRAACRPTQARCFRKGSGCPASGLRETTASSTTCSGSSSRTCGCPRWFSAISTPSLPPSASRNGAWSRRWSDMGAETTLAVFDHILRSSEARGARRDRGAADGDYRAEDVIDGDGVDPSKIPVQVDRAHSRATEWRSISRDRACARKAPINCSAGALQSAVKTIFKALVAPHEPSNEGWFRPLTIIAPPGTVFSAEKPVPTGWYYEGSAQASELVWKALAPLAPQRFSAGSYLSLCATYIVGSRAGRASSCISSRRTAAGARAETETARPA